MADLRSRLTGIVATAATAGSLILVAPVAPAAAGSAPVGASAASAVAAPTRERNRKVSRSLRGVRSSAYIGRHYSPRHERTRRCIVRKESGGNYRIASRGGTYQGAYQFNRSLARRTAVRMGRRDLARRPMRTWSRFHQDKAFWIVWNRGRGARNWPTRHGC